MAGLRQGSSKGEESVVCGFCRRCCSDTHLSQTRKVDKRQVKDAGPVNLEVDGQLRYALQNEHG